LCIRHFLFLLNKKNNFFKNLLNLIKNKMNRTIDKKHVETKDDNIYYNINIVNNSKIVKAASFTQQLTGSIVDNPNDYYMAVARFAITGTVIPLFLWPRNTIVTGTIGNDLVPTNSGTLLNVTAVSDGIITIGMTLQGTGVTPGTTIVSFGTGTGGIGTYTVSVPSLATSTYLYTSDTYIVTLTKLGVDYKEPVLFSDTGGVPTLTATNYVAGVYAYSAFLRAINAAYARAAVRASCSAPYLIYEPNGGLISLYCLASEFEESVVNRIDIFMDNILFGFFDNFYIEFFSQGSYNGKDVRIITLNQYGTNASSLAGPPTIVGGLDPSIQAGYLKISQEGSNNQRFWQPNAIVFKTTRMGVRPEYTQGAYNASSGSTGIVNTNNSGAGLPFDTIMTDFIPGFSSGEQIGWRQDLEYNPQFYRLIDLLGNTSNTVDLSIFWTDQLGNEYPFFLEANKAASVKLIFVKKSLIKNFVN